MRRWTTVLLQAFLLLVCLASAAVAQADLERAWRVDLRLVGPLESAAVVTDVGRTDWAQPLLPGETRRLRLPVPARSPLGADGLARVALPELLVDGEPPAPGGSRLEGWSAEQPAALVERLPPGLFARPLPPVAERRRRAGEGGLLLLVTAFVLGLFLRRRRWSGPLLAALSAAVLLGVSWREGGPAPPVVVLEGDLERDLWLEVRVAQDRLAGPTVSLAVQPERDLQFSCGPVPGAATEAPIELARAPGAALIARRRLGSLAPGNAPRLGLARNALGDFEACSLRSPDGRWTALGAWERDAPFPSPGRSALEAGTPPETPESALSSSAAPPGWLATGLPPGRWVLVGRLGDGRWVRATGFGQSEESR